MSSTVRKTLERKIREAYGDPVRAMRHLGTDLVDAVRWVWLGASGRRVCPGCAGMGHRHNRGTPEGCTECAGRGWVPRRKDH